MDLDDLLEDALSAKVFKKSKKKLKKSKKKLKKLSKKTARGGCLLAGLTAMVVGLLTWLKAQLLGGERRSHAEASPGQRSKVEQAHDDPLFEGLQRIREYRDRIAALAQNASAGSADRLRFEKLSTRVNTWTTSIETMVERTLAQASDPLLETERTQVPKAIARLEKQRSKAKDPTLRAKLERTLESRRQQLAQLEQQAKARQFIELKVEQAVAQLGTMYAKAHSGGGITSHTDGWDEVSAEIEEELQALHDYQTILAELHVPVHQAH